MIKQSNYFPAMKYGAEMDYPNDGIIAFHGSTALSASNLKGWILVDIGGTDYKIPVYDTIA